MSGLLSTSLDIYRESPAVFYRGLGAVLSGIIPKMAVRFGSFELYSSVLRSSKEESTRLSASQMFAGRKLISFRPGFGHEY